MVWLSASPATRRAQPVPPAAGHPAAVERQDLRQLEDEQAERGQHEQQRSGTRTASAPAISPTDQTSPISRNTSPSASPTQGSQPVTKCQRWPSVSSRLNGEQQRAANGAADLHRAIGPAEALLAKGGEVVRHHAAAEALRRIDRLPAVRGTAAGRAPRPRVMRPLGPAAGLLAAPRGGSASWCRAG